MGSLSNNQNFQDTVTTMEPPQICVIVVPFPAQGYLNQLLQLSCLISSHAIPVCYAGSAIHDRQAKARINGLNPLNLAKIEFRDLPTPPFASPLLDPNSPNKFPSQLQPAWDTTLSLHKPMASFLHDMSREFKRVVVVHDPMMAFMVQDVLIQNAELYAFNCISEFSQAFFNIWEGLDKPLSTEGTDDMPDLEDCLTDEVQHIAALQIEPLRYRARDLYNTCRLIEVPYMELLEREEIKGKRKTWAISPILPAALSPHNKEQHKCLEWLDKQEPNSVIYISFGMTTSLSDKQINELAFGLERSKVKFIWVLRDADKAYVFDGQVRRVELLDRFEERLEGAGIVVRDWVPQPRILARPSTGGFMSHCGWNSCMESIPMVFGPKNEFFV